MTPRSSSNRSRGKLDYSNPRSLSLLAFALAAGCATSRSSVRPPYVARPASPDANLPRTPLADHVIAEGVPGLRTVLLPAGVREIRITDWYSMMAGGSVPVLRVIEDRGVASGELAFVWKERPGWPSRYRATRCSERTDSSRVCVYVVPKASAPDWRRIATRLDSLGAWQISERCEDNRVIDDAGDLIIERLDAERFEQYRCNAPDFRRESAAGARAAVIYDYFMNLARAFAP